MAKDVARYIREECGGGDNGASCSILRHSMGGKVAMHLALTRSEMVDRLIVADVAPVVYPAVGGDHAQLIEAMIKLPLSLVHSLNDAHEPMAASVPSKAIRDFLLTNLVIDKA